MASRSIEPRSARRYRRRVRLGTAAAFFLAVARFRRMLGRHHDLPAFVVGLVEHFIAEGRVGQTQTM